MHSKVQMNNLIRALLCIDEWWTESVMQDTAIIAGL